MLIQTASPSTVQERLPTLYSERNLKQETMGRRIGAFLEWRKRGGFHVLDIEHQDESELDLVFQFPVTRDHWRLRIVMAKDGSGMIDEVLMGRAPMAPIEDPLQDDEIAEEFLAYVTDLARAELFSGTVLIGRHGKVLGEAAVGLANREFASKNTAETRFNVASLTKSWTALTAMQLVEEGRLAIEDPVCEIVQPAGHRLDPRIEIRHLLSHSSGLGDYFGPKFDATPKRKIRHLDDFLKLAETFKSAFEPGTKSKYSNIGYITLGKVIEAVTEMTYYEAVNKAIFEPSAMTTAGFPNLDEVNINCATGYGFRWDDSGPVPINCFHEWAVRGGSDGCAYASVRDIWKYTQALRNHRIVSEDTLALMTSPKPNLASPDYGFGFEVIGDGKVFGHSGGLLGASANVDFINEPEGWVVIVLANDLTMRNPVVRARHLIGVTAQERDGGRSHLPRAGLTPR